MNDPLDDYLGNGHAQSANGKSRISDDQWPEDRLGDAWVAPEVSQGNQRPDRPTGRDARGDYELHVVQDDQGYVVGNRRVYSDGSTAFYPASVRIFSVDELVSTYPERRPALIDQVLRKGETANIIAPPKYGKSWLTIELALAVAQGKKWLGTFETTKKPVLIIDNELHRETISHRLQTVCDARGLDRSSLQIEVIPLRGQLQDLIHMGQWLGLFDPGQYGLVIIDAWYRSLPRGTDENDNAQVANLYNCLDEYAERIGSSFALVHHSSKGNQAGKSVTDVGSGAGSQSRAADSHIVLRAHEEENVVVMEAAVRSFAPFKPICLRWDYPIWSPEPDLDPTLLQQAVRKPKNQSPSEPKWDANRFAEAFGRDEPRVRSLILDDAVRAGLSNRQAIQLLKCAAEQDLLYNWQEGGAAGKTWFSKKPKPAEKLEPVTQSNGRKRGGK